MLNPKFSEMFDLKKSCSLLSLELNAFIIAVLFCLLQTVKFKGGSSWRASERPTTVILLWGCLLKFYVLVCTPLKIKISFKNVYLFYQNSRTKIGMVPHQRYRSIQSASLMKAELIRIFLCSHNMLHSIWILGACLSVRANDNLSKKFGISRTLGMHPEGFGIVGRIRIIVPVIKCR